jgi:hypothetical protein
MVLNALTTCTLAGAALAISCAAEVPSGVTSPVAPELKVLLMSTMTISPAGTSPVVPRRGGRLEPEHLDRSRKHAVEGLDPGKLRP